ncbi:MAG: 3-hydroxyacyl-ACP dehydratase FabZ [Candidatus Sumerlaeia bacterium]|nr:3-hydroxyacyl-ACP dehydratase FabZ [Candidatus Sumerlaeia bacterium]
MNELEMPQVVDILGVMKQLPHRYPFLLVDRVVEWEAGKRLVAIKNVTINEPFFQGHFPGEPVMPGVLIVEAMAQTGGLLIGLSRPDETGLLYLLASVRNARFRKPVRPGDQLRLEVISDSVRSIAPRVEAKARVGDVIVAEAEIMFALARREK